MFESGSWRCHFNQSLTPLSLTKLDIHKQTFKHHLAMTALSAHPSAVSQLGCDYHQSHCRVQSTLIVLLN